MDDTREITGCGLFSKYPSISKCTWHVSILRRPLSPPRSLPSSSPFPGPSTSRGEDDPKFIAEMLKANPEQMSLLRQNNPRLAEALDSGNLSSFESVLKEQQEARRERDRMRMRMLTADPFDMEAQRLIAQVIERDRSISTR